MIAVYRCLLKLYPPVHRQEFAEEMLDVLLQAENDIECQGMFERTTSYLREILGLTRGALREQLHSANLHPRQQFNVGGNMIQRTRYRFPRSATVMMTVVLVIVLGMIAKIQGVSHFYGNLITGELPHKAWQWPSYYGLISGIFVCFLLAWIAGAAVWAIAYAMHRTAAQQLGNFESRPQGRS